MLDESTIQPLDVVLRPYLIGCEELGPLSSPQARKDLLAKPMTHVSRDNLTIGEILNTGTFTTDVYEGTLLRESRIPVAVKVYKGNEETLNSDYKGLEVGHQSFPRNFPPVYGETTVTTPDGNRRALVVGLVKGKTLEKAMADGLKIKEEFFCELETVVRGLHRLGVIARDTLRITGENIMINEFERPVLIEIELSPNREGKIEAAEDLLRLERLKTKFLLKQQTGFTDPGSN